MKYKLRKDTLIYLEGVNRKFLRTRFVNWAIVTFKKLDCRVGIQSETGSIIHLHVNIITT